MRLPTLLFTAVVAILAAVAMPSLVLAHKVIADVYVTGDAIEGEIGFSSGDMAADTTVEVFDEAGNKLGEAKTNAEGFFTFTPEKPVTHVFRADLGAGHVAEARIEAADLPKTLAGAGAAPPPADATSATAATAGPAEVADAANLSEEQRALVAEAVRREIRPLRREIAAYKEKNDLQAIMGGLGYIIGLFGIGFYFAARRSLKTPS